MPYRCKTCGSLQVYHNCIVRHPMTDSAIKAPPPPPPPPQPPPPPPPPYAPPAVDVPDPLLPLCDNRCGCVAETTLRGLRRKNGRNTRVVGDSLCMNCYEQLKDMVEEHIPHPPGWPAGYYVARLHARKKVAPDVAITLLWCHGRLVRAAILKRSGRVSPVNVDSL